MPKIIELTVELDVQRVSCPGVWLCQDGRVSLTVFALGTSYQTCLLPPVFPLTFKDVFYFKKRFQETCALNNICCLLKDETIYCELVQWCVDCQNDECVILAQYLGSLNDVLFPPNMCSNEGVDLLMRRSKDFPGILSPKIEIATKVRIDEVWNQIATTGSTLKVNPCVVPPQDESKRQKQVCHTARYHRNMCTKHGKPSSASRSRSRSGSRPGSGSRDSKSISSLSRKGGLDDPCDCPNPAKAFFPRSRPKKSKTKAIAQDFCVYNMRTQLTDPVTCVSAWRNGTYVGHGVESEDEDDTKRSRSRSRSSSEQCYPCYGDEERRHKTIIESHYIGRNRSVNRAKKTHEKKKIKNCTKTEISPCVCEICKRYHELFHLKNKGT